MVAMIAQLRPALALHVLQETTVILKVETVETALTCHAHRPDTSSCLVAMEVKRQMIPGANRWRTIALHYRPMLTVPFHQEHFSKLRQMEVKQGTLVVDYPAQPWKEIVLSVTAPTRTNYRLQCAPKIGYGPFRAHVH